VRLAFSEIPNKSSAFMNSTGCGVFACRAGMAVALLVMRPDGLNKGGLEEKSAWLGQPGRTPATGAGN